MPFSRARRSSPEVSGLRVAVLDICQQLRRQASEQVRLIRSGAADELTEADVARMADDITAAARARLDSADSQSLSADPELPATRREAAQLMAAAARQVDEDLRKAWQARQEKVTDRRA